VNPSPLANANPERDFLRLQVEVEEADCSASVEFDLAGACARLRAREAGPRTLSRF
jgi:hypothetical protein